MGMSSRLGNSSEGATAPNSSALAARYGLTAQTLPPALTGEGSGAQFGPAGGLEEAIPEFRVQSKNQRNS